MRAGAGEGQTRVTESLGTRVLNSCESPDLCSGN